MTTELYYNLPEPAGESITRELVVIDGENYYLAVGDTLIQATVPRENAPMMEKTRLIVETLCDAISRVLEKRYNDKQAMQQMPQAVPRPGATLPELPTAGDSCSNQAD